MRGRLGLGARAEIAGSSPVVRVIGDSATGMVDPLLPGPIWRASARPNPPAQVLPPPFFPFRPHLKFPKRCRPEGGCAMGSEQQSTAAAREVLAGSVARERKEVAARARAAKLRTMRGEKAATTATAAHGRKVATAAPLPRLEEQRFAAPSLASGRSSTGPTFGAPPRSTGAGIFPATPRAYGGTNFSGGPSRRSSPMARQEPASQPWIHADVTDW